MILQVLRFLFVRIWIIYLGLGCFAWFVFDRNSAMDNASAQALSRFNPTVKYFKLLDHSAGESTRSQLHDCIYYHQMVANSFFYQAAEAYSMLGFCYERLGDEHKAQQAYQKSMTINQAYMWPFYNLGVMAFRKADYPKAIDYFQQALERDPAQNVVLLNYSKVYMDVKSTRPEEKYDFSQGVRRSYSNAFLLLMVSLEQTKNYSRLFGVALKGMQDNSLDQGLFYYYAGVAAFRLHLYDKAINFLQQAINKEPRNADAFLYLSLCFKALGRDDLVNEFMAMGAKVNAQYGGWLKSQINTDVRFF